MSDISVIEWTDATWQPITGCSLASPGCTNCYAMRLAGGRLRHIPSRAGLTKPSKAGPVWTGEVRFNESFLDQPRRWRKPRRIFVCAHGDLFHESVPDEWIDRVFAVMATERRHTFQVLTKRAERLAAYMAGKSPLANVWIGVSVEDQRRADERLPFLQATPAAVRFVSFEPLLGSVEVADWTGIHWAIIGAESGPGARPCSLDWVRALRDRCTSAGVRFFFKQHVVNGRKVSLPELDGRQWVEWPQGADGGEAQ